MNRQAILDALCPLPSPNSTEEEFIQFCHKDLETLTVEELRTEQERIRFRLIFDDAPDPWFLERFKAIEEELRHASS